MEQRTSIMVSALVFAAVIAGSVAYLIYSNPGTEVAQESPTPTVTPVEPTPVVAEDSAERAILPIQVVPNTPRPTPTPTVAASVNVSAPTGPSEWIIGLTALSAVLGGAGMVVSSRKLGS